ncbi:MAG: ABC transporter ATP-binding protein [Halobacteriota archaeon]|uniref:ABC transporter ATP-binding protein n=1 Tax=Natronomonas sp. TaxID=2184060 RepID=UPI0039751262
MTKAVQLENITKRFPGGVLANDEVDLAVEEGTVHALLGENGAGKTTLMNVLYGLYEPTDGTVHVGGERVAFDSPQDAIERGVGMIHQHFTLVGPMTVLENVALGWEPIKYRGIAIDDDRIERDIRALNNRYGFDLGDVIHAPVERLSVGVQQRVEVIKTLYRGADVFIFDEPTAVLTPQEATELFQIFEELTAQNKTIIFITHKLDEALTAADNVTVLREGRNVETVNAAETTQELLAQKMVGRDVLLNVEQRPTSKGTERLTVSDLSVEDDRGIEKVRNLEFSVQSGEIFGIAGVDGNGQTELVEAITGLQAVADGTIEFDGVNVTGDSRRARMERGLSYIPGERQERALVLDFDLVKNAVLGNQHRSKFSDGRLIDWDAARAHTEEIIRTYDVRPPDPSAVARSLSGGNQQKFVVGREFSRDPDIVVAAHPTRGVDIGSMEFIHEQLLEMRERGVAILLVSASLDEVTGLSDRIGVIHDGSFVDVVTPDSVTEEQLGLLMAGERPEGTVSTS